MLRAVVTWLLGFAALAFAALMLGAMHGESWLSVIACHLAGATCGAFCAARTERPGAAPSGPVWGMALAVPLLGWFGAWLMAASVRWSARGSAREDYLEYIDARARLGEAYLFPERRRTAPAPLHLEPLADVLNSGASDDDKRKAIESLMQLETPEAVLILREALAQGSPEVRFCATAALANLEERLTRRLQTLENEPELTPWAHGVHHLELAKAHFDHAYFHLAEEAGWREHLEKTVEDAVLAWKHGGDPAALVLRGRALLELKRHAEAAAAFDEYLEYAGEDAKVLIWRAEARFHQGRYRDVRGDCARARAAGAIPLPLRAAVEMWTGGAWDAPSSGGASDLLPETAGKA